MPSSATAALLRRNKTGAWSFAPSLPPSLAVRLYDDHPFTALRQLTHARPTRSKHAPRDSMVVVEERHMSPCCTICCGTM
eukprot:6203096-Pleurochrysis_carterae.AAC.2